MKKKFLEEYLVNFFRVLYEFSLTCSSKLEPKLSEAEVFDLVQVCTDSLFSLSPTGLPNRKGKEESPTEILEVEAMMTAAFSAMFEIFKELINKDCTPTGLENIFKVT